MNDFSILAGFVMLLSFVGCESRNEVTSQYLPVSNHNSTSTDDADANEFTGNLKSRSNPVFYVIEAQKELELAVSLFSTAESNFGVSVNPSDLAVNASCIDQMTESINIVKRIESMVSGYGGTSVGDLRTNLESRRNHHLKRLKSDATFIVQKADYETAMQWLDY